MTDGERLVAEMVAKACRVLEQAACPFPIDASPMDIASAAKRWETEQIEGNAAVKAAVEVLEAAHLCSLDDPIYGGIRLGQRFAGLEMQLSPLPRQFAKQHMRERKAGIRGGLAKTARAMALWGDEALLIIKQLVDSGSYKKKAPVIRDLQDAWPANNANLPENPKSIDELIGKEIRRLIDEKQKRNHPRVDGRRRR